MNALETALYSALAANNTLVSLLGGTAIYQDPAPQGTSYPFVVFSFSSEVDSYVMGARAYEENVYLVKGITRGQSASLAGSVAAQIDTTLDHGSLNISGHSNLLTRRDSVVKYSETDDGEIYRHHGGLYRIVVQ